MQCYTVPYHTIPYTIPYHTIPYHAMPCHAMPYHTIPYYASDVILYSTMLSHTKNSIFAALTTQTACADERTFVFAEPTAVIERISVCWNEINRTLKDTSSKCHWLSLWNFTDMVLDLLTGMHNGCARAY